MDRLQKLEKDVSRKIKKYGWRSPLSMYWENKWEAVVALHMEYEWFLHPNNPENFYNVYGV